MNVDEPVWLDSSHFGHKRDEGSQDQFSFASSSQMALEALASKAWSASSLEAGLSLVDLHAQQLQSANLTEEEMEAELKALWPRFSSQNCSGTILGILKWPTGSGFGGMLGDRA